MYLEVLFNENWKMKSSLFSRSKQSHVGKQSMCTDAHYRNDAREIESNSIILFHNKIFWVVLE